MCTFGSIRIRDQIDPVQTPISLDKGLYKHVHLFCLTFSANVGHYMALIEAYRGLDRVILLVKLFLRVHVGPFSMRPAAVVYTEP